MPAQMLSIIVTTVKKVQTAKDPDQFSDFPVQLVLPLGLSYSDAKDACLEFVGAIEEMAIKAAEAAKKAEEDKAVEPEVVNVQ
jgi:hypothetical protein